MCCSVLQHSHSFQSSSTFCAVGDEHWKMDHVPWLLGLPLEATNSPHLPRNLPATLCHFIPLRYLMHSGHYLRSYLKRNMEEMKLSHGTARGADTGTSSSQASTPFYSQRNILTFCQCLFDELSRRGLNSAAFPHLLSISGFMVLQPSAVLLQPRAGLVACGTALPKTHHTARC